MNDFDNEYNFKTISNENVLNKIVQKITSFSKNTIKVIEFGTGIGAITIPVLKNLLNLNPNEKIKIEWEGFDTNEEAIKYFKGKFKSELRISENFIKDSITINNTNVSLGISLKIYDIERGIINNTEPFNSGQVYDIIFMPSFLYHITFWKTVLVWAYNHLKKDGLIILGYPSGVWSFPEKGFLSVSDKSIKKGEKIWFDAWQSFYKNNPNYYLFFRRHYNELHDVLLANVIIKDIIEVNLTSPTKDVLLTKIKNKEFAFNKSDCPFNFNIKDEDINKLTNTITSSDKFDYQYTFEVLQKTEDSKEITLKDTFVFNHSLNSKSIDISFISKEPKTANQLLNYGLIKTLLGEGILERQYHNDLSIIGSYVGYHLDNFIKKADDKSIADNYDVMFFSLPKENDIMKLHNYLCFYNTPKSAPITEILKTILPKTKPFCKYLLLEYKNCDGSSEIITSYDDVREIAKISITIPNSLLENKDDLYSKLVKKDNKPEEKFNENKNELIILPYSKNKNDKELNKLLDGFFSQLSSNSDSDKDELSIYEFYKQLGNEKNEIRQRLQLLAYLMLKSENKSSLGIPLKITINGEQKLLGIIWLVYNKEFNKIENYEIPIIDLYLNNILYPIIGRINLALIDLLRLELDNQQLKTAIISILIDSYAHNISAHSLAALKWWIELRHKMLDKRFYVDEVNGLKLENLLPNFIEVEQNFIKDTSEKYYETLGLTDSKYNKEFYSLFDYLQFTPDEKLKDIFSFRNSNDNLCTDKLKGVVSNISKKEKKESSKAVKSFFPRFPVPIDYALFPFFRFLRDKGAFWSGVTRDTAYGGESKTWYQILWEDFANNPLYLGTIAKSEKISKVNINLAVKTDDGWIKGRFVTIDMSIIDEENGNIHSDNCSQNEISEIKKDDCNFNASCAVDYSKYSKYAFVKLGGCFKALREELSKDKYNVFLPGGLIGEHALFTIFENTLRNIKHYKNVIQLSDIRKNGIDFWISIDEERLSTQNKGDKKPELFKVSIWLEHKTDLLKFDENNELKECLWQKVTDSTLKPILDENGVPRMGGNSQDKACAAMLFNNKFISVESKEGKGNSFYYPWIHFTTNTNNNHYDSKFDIPTTRDDNLQYYSANEEKSKIFIGEYVNKLNQDKKGYLKKYFYLWRSEDYIQIKNRSDLVGENVSRFKFVILSDKIKGSERDELINEIRENGIIRLLYKKNDEDSFSSENLINKLENEIPKQIKDTAIINNERLKTLYDVWLKEWIKYDEKFMLGFKKDTNIWAMIKIDKDNKIISYHRNENKCDYSELINNINITLQLSHGGDDENKSCNVRSHGYFWGKYFINALGKDPEDLGNRNVYVIEKDYLLMDFLEVIATRIEIFDNRIYLRMSQLDGTKRNKVFGDYLRLKVYEEEIKDENDKSNIFKQNILSLKNTTDPLILIIHLSYIEAMGYPEENINLFIKDHLEELFVKENFIFVLTSGRGRDKWKKDLDVKYRKQTIFKSVESLIGAVESGLSYNDNFDVKHNLIKVIFGS